MFYFLFIILLFFRFIKFNKPLLIKRTQLPKFCIYITSDNYLHILDLLVYQNYPKDLFDVYIKEDINHNYKFNVFKQDVSFIKNNNYDLITIINNSIDINFLNFTSLEYLKGYDLIIGKSMFVSRLLLIKKYIYNFLGNPVVSECFSFNTIFLYNNVLNLDNTYLLKKFIFQKTKLYTFNKNIKNMYNIDTTNSKINPLDKRNIIIKVYLILNISIILLATNYLFITLFYLYLFSVFYNIFYLRKHDKINYLTCIFLPFYLVIYLLFFRINNMRSYVNPV